MVSSLVCRVVICGAALLVGAVAQAAGVSRVAPEALVDFLRTNPRVVVSYNSPDPNCGYCGRAVDQAFAEVARGFGDDVKFISVQWTPWKTFPAAATQLGVSGIPAHQVVRNGNVVHVQQGKLPQPADYAAIVRGLLPPLPAVAAVVAPPAASASPPAPVNAVSPGPVILPLVAADGTNPVAACERFRDITDRSAIPWSVNGADATFCGQTAIGFYPTDSTGAIAAFKKRQLVGLRDHAAPSPNPTWTSGPVGDAARVTSGYSEVPGELWWGLLKDKTDVRQAAIGQETHVRLFAALNATDPRRASELRLGKMQAPFPRAPETRYEFVDATPVTSPYGLGGRGPIADGRVVSAQLTVATKDPIQGTLQLELQIEGGSFSLSLPLKRNLMEAWPRSTIQPWQMNQLVSGSAGAAGAVADCVETPSSTTRTMCKMALPGGKPGTTIQYEARVFFFGPQSNLAVVTFALLNLSWEGPNARSFVNSNGLIVFRAQ